ncbi:hypothetical protein VTJ49DRAFT_5559 [Mycothermus thermophilus]|uniref:Uncharacterized protein n=1 Tax=Humicola insolens TaxID=85995 RepID=A0ABR3V2V3_HUMIN
MCSTMPPRSPTPVDPHLRLHGSGSTAPGFRLPMPEDCGTGEVLAGSKFFNTRPQVRMGNIISKVWPGKPSESQDDVRSNQDTGTAASTAPQTPEGRAAPLRSPVPASQGIEFCLLSDVLLEAPIDSANLSEDDVFFDATSTMSAPTGGPAIPPRRRDTTNSAPVPSHLSASTAILSSPTPAGADTALVNDWSLQDTLRSMLGETIAGPSTTATAVTTPDQALPAAAANSSDTGTLYNIPLAKSITPVPPDWDQLARRALQKPSYPALVLSGPDVTNPAGSTTKDTGSAGTSTGSTTTPRPAVIIGPLSPATRSDWHRDAGRAYLTAKLGLAVGNRPGEDAGGETGGGQHIYDTFRGRGGRGRGRGRRGGRMGNYHGYPAGGDPGLVWCDLVQDGEGMWYVRAEFERREKAEVAVGFFEGGYPCGGSIMWAWMGEGKE